jgi:hypothetical protein
MNQKEAVYGAIKSVFANSGKTFEDGDRVTLTKEETAMVVSIVASGISNGTVEFSAESKPKHEKDGFKSYTGGLVNNWLRKDKRLNGNVKHEIKNPGSRTGSQDSQVKTLKELRKTFINDPAKLAEIDSALTKRQTELAAEKAAATVKAVDLTAIPEELKKSLGL